MGDRDRTPLVGEVLREFFVRTGNVWCKDAALALLQNAQNDSSKLQQEDSSAAAEAIAAEALRGKHSEALSSRAVRGKELRREAFELCQIRFKKLQPVLSRLNVLQQEQEEAERRAAMQAAAAAKAARGGGGGATKKKKKKKGKR